MNRKIYLHEYIDIILQGRPKYFEHMTRGFSQLLAGDRPLKCFAVWGTLGSTGRWPECIDLSELDSWEEAARHFSIEVGHPSMQDPKLKIWWGEAQKHRSGGLDRMAMAAPCSPTLAEMCADRNVVGAKVFYHERISITPGQAKTYLSMLEQEWLPVAKTLGLHLVAALRTAMRNDSECIVIWALRERSDWARVEHACETGPRVAVRRRRTQGVAIDWLNHLMVSAPLSRTQTGKAP